MFIQYKNEIPFSLRNSTTHKPHDKHPKNIKTHDTESKQNKKIEKGRILIHDCKYVNVGFILFSLDILSIHCAVFISSVYIICKINYLLFILLIIHVDVGPLDLLKYKLLIYTWTDISYCMRITISNLQIYMSNLFHIVAVLSFFVHRIFLLNL